jgi:hypothetical protein
LVEAAAEEVVALVAEGTSVTEIKVEDRVPPADHLALGNQLNETNPIPDSPLCGWTIC